MDVFQKEYVPVPPVTWPQAAERFIHHIWSFLTSEIMLILSCSRRWKKDGCDRKDKPLSGLCSTRLTPSGWEDRVHLEELYTGKENKA
ncbi:hypothetical protein AV530_016039 [Patagioenas fasciata monilis]|uniref:Uncharacterized protein n=1 Tax=Patagioenas fasciata monilis TaxID=372326 RepID=A0A1V4KLM6_PATFA|nr:hypothetical protein AV530_016039 [Patagioenas fasciata monilis]